MLNARQWGGLEILPLLVVVGCTCRGDDRVGKWEGPRLGKGESILLAGQVILELCVVPGKIIHVCCVSTIIVSHYRILTRECCSQGWGAGPTQVIWGQLGGCDQGLVSCGLVIFSH